MTDANSCDKRPVELHLKGRLAVKEVADVAMAWLLTATLVATEILSRLHRLRQNQRYDTFGHSIDSRSLVAVCATGLMVRCGSVSTCSSIGADARLCSVVPAEC